MNLCIPQGAGLLVFALSVWATLAAAPASAAPTEPSCAGALRTVATTGELQKAIKDVRYGVLAPGSVIRLKAATFRLARDGEPLSLNNVYGTSEACPITIEGAGDDTLLDGNRTPDNEQFGHRLRVALSAGAERLLDTEMEVLKKLSTGMPTEAPINCLKIERAAWITIQNLKISGCWPTAVYLRDASYITVRGATLLGSTYAIIAHGRSHHLLIEDNRWTQDVTGDVWSRIPWGVSHHGSKAHLNGALFGGYNIQGAVVIRRNLIRHAYNGIRIKASCLGREACDKNMNVEIAHNRFEFIRDNSVEPEGSAVNWWVRHNKMRDVHAPYSFDGVRGGPHYVFGNVGWFTEMPEQHCEDQVWAEDREPLGKLTAHRECRLHRMGKTFKLGNVQKRPLHIFHNSWLARSPLVGGGGSGPLRAWNNAIEFCGPGETSVICKAPSHLLHSGGRKKLRWLEHAVARSVEHNIRFNVSNRPLFPTAVKKPGFPITGRWADGLGFRDGRHGDFRLQPGSPARRAGCMIQKHANGELTCTRPPDGFRPDVGAYQGARLIKGPSFRHVDGALGPDRVYVERPRVVDVAFDAVRPERFSISFSVPIKLAGPAETVTLWLEEGTIPLTAMCGVAEGGSRVLTCELSSGGVRTAEVSAIDLPRTIHRDGGTQAAVTLWAAADRRVRFAD
ncbi:MAG: right-handed parallel beta-helix repeat-containing protein [Pseudomonadota bacterium]